MKFYKKLIPLVLLSGVILAGCGAQHHKTHQSAESTQTRSMTPNKVKHDLTTDQNGANQKTYSTDNQAKAGVQRQINRHPEVSNAIQAQKSARPSNSASDQQRPGAVDLGHGITGHQDHGAGQTYVSFKMGRWQIVVHGNDVNEKSNSAVDHAKSLVNYLQNHTLPIPTSQGIIQVDLGEDSIQMSWDKNHKMNTLSGKPSAILQKAVILK